ncbi:6-pyruvoyl-tetrahydropterin synthase-related protein [Solidesulfovibrio sp.]|uniref:6-pyruvoyl-tetrahydropterin synthase-related protein n=1 Tax=Solidesulfovibrio sp. TaxID=2910990 RepID=UPI00261C12A2|nr:6-pyruvoyl-tetrahydropterin synthase-related protein [Solidesulfovibrio sp.]
MKRRLAALGVVALFAVLAFRGILFAPGHVYQNWDNVTPPFTEEIRRLAVISQYGWNAHFDLGTPGGFGGINRWFDIVVREGLAPLGGPFLAKFLPLAYAVVGGAGILALCAALGLGALPSLAAALLFAFNPRQYTLAISGHVQESGFALALLPWIVWLLWRAVTAAGRRRRLGLSLAAGLLGALACSASPFGIVFFAAATVLFTLAATASRRDLRPLAVFVVAGAAVATLSLHWVVPAGLSLAGGGATVKYHQTAEDVRENYVGMYRHFSAPPRQAMLGHTDNYGMGTEYAYPVNFKENPAWIAAALGLLGLALTGLAYRGPARALKWFAVACLLAGFTCMAGSKTLAGAVFYEKFLARVPMIFYLMARPARWLPLYFTGLSLLAAMGLAVVSRRAVWRESRLPDVAAGAFAAACLAVYLAPYWNGSVAVPKNATTQTMALMPQPVSPAEGALAKALSADPDDYRVTVWPTIAGPTGDVPASPADAVTRNFAMFGKDALMGPTFIGEPFSRYLLTVLMRPWPATDRFGRLLGLAAVRRVLYDPAVSYLSYGSFGWMPTTKRGPETLFDPGDILAPFVAAQADLRPDASLAAPPVEVLANADSLPRLRLAHGGVLAAGGFPLLLSLANGEGGDFPGRVLYAGADLDAAQAKRLGDALSGVAVAGRSWPELLLPFLPAEAFVPARQAVLAGSWGNLAGQVLDDPRLGGAALDGGGKVSQGPGKAEFPLIGHGSWRIFARLGAAPLAGRTVVALDGAPVAELDAGPLGRGLDWIDCGTATFEPGPPHALTVAAPGRGTYVSGVLAVPEEAFEEARAAVAALAGRGGVTLVVEAEEATTAPAVSMAPRLTVPLLAAEAGVAAAKENAQLRDVDPMGGGVVAVEGDAPGEIAFTVRFPVPAHDVVLEAYPRLFGDKASPSFVAAEASVDGGPFRPLFRVEGKSDDRWEDVYGRREAHRIPGPATTLTVRFAMRQAQLSSQANAPNQPMRLVAETPVPGGATLSFGAAARLPAVLDLAAPVPGDYVADLRLIGPAGAAVSLPDGRRLTFEADGALDVSGLAVATDADGRARLALSGPAAVAVDRLSLSREATTPPAPPGLSYARVNPGHYTMDLPPGSGGKTLVFAESFHPGWRLRLADGREVVPLRGYGFLNAYLLPSGAEGPASLVFRDEAAMARLRPVTAAAWGVLGLACAALLVPWPGGRARSDD